MLMVFVAPLKECFRWGYSPPIVVAGPFQEMVREQILPEIDKQLPKMLRGSVSFPKAPKLQVDASCNAGSLIAGCCESFGRTFFKNHH